MPQIEIAKVINEKLDNIEKTKLDSIKTVGELIKLTNQHEELSLTMKGSFWERK